MCRGNQGRRAEGSTRGLVKAHWLWQLAKAMDPSQPDLNLNFSFTTSVWPQGSALTFLSLIFFFSSGAIKPTFPGLLWPLHDNLYESSLSNTNLPLLNAYSASGIVLSTLYAQERYCDYPCFIAEESNAQVL